MKLEHLAETDDIIHQFKVSITDKKPILGFSSTKYSVKVIHNADTIFSQNLRIGEALKVYDRAKKIIDHAISIYNTYGSSIYINEAVDDIKRKKILYNKGGIVDSIMLYLNEPI